MLLRSLWALGGLATLAIAEKPLFPRAANLTAEPGSVAPDEKSGDNNICAYYPNVCCKPPPPKTVTVKVCDVEYCGGGHPQV